MAVLVEARNSSLGSVGPLEFSKLELTPRFNAVGSWSITLPATARTWEMTRLPDVGIVVDWNGVYRFSGQAETWKYEQTIQDGKISELITLSGADDLGIIANRIAYPNPTVVWASQLAASTDVRTAVPAESAIKYYVNRNAGPAALSGRKVPALTIATDLGRGGTVSYAARFGEGVELHLMDIIRQLIATGGPLGVSITQQGAGLVFDCYEPRDLSEAICFSVALGSLRSTSMSTTTPTATNALVRGQSTFIETAGPDATNQWLHTEQLVSQTSSTDSTEMTQAGNDALASGAGKVQLALSTVDLPRLRFGVDGPDIQGYGLGDLVTVEIREGVVFTDFISAVQLTCDDEGETVTPIIGSAGSDSSSDSTATAQLAAKVRDLERQLKRLLG